MGKNLDYFRYCHGEPLPENEWSLLEIAAVAAMVAFLAGGVCLELYSIFLQDPIFIILQLVFIISAVWDLYKAK